jgi:hypothetical protein
MFFDMQVAETIRELQERRIAARERHVYANPDAEVPRTGAGRVHEVFRRIAEGGEPERTLNTNWRWTFVTR